MDKNQNAVIIRQLYKQVANQNSTPTINWPTRSSFPSNTVSHDTSCLKNFQQFFESINKAFPVYALKIESLVLKEDQVMVRYNIQGTQTGDFMGMAPTREPMMISGVDIFHINNGRVVKHWDTTHQVNILPGPNRENPRPSRTGALTA